MTPVCLEPKQYERVKADAGRVLPRELWHRMERIVAAMALIVLVPVLITIAALIAILSRRNPLIRHTRVGWRGRPLPMLKFRTMWDARSPVAGRFSIETVSGPPTGLKRSVDPRVISHFAAFCRRHSLDELPQLCHVVSGEMSFVGPRPITAEELSEYYGHCASEILSVRPGMTGLWQVRGRSRLNYARRKHFDLVLVRRASASLYFGILLRSFAAVLSGRDAY